MSHIAKIDLEIRDLNCLKSACTSMGLEFMEGQTNYKWYGRFVGDSPMPKGMNESMLGHSDHAIKVPGARYEVGVIKDATKNVWSLHCDEYSPGGLPKVLGMGAGKLKQAYTKEVVKKAAKMKHLSVKEEMLENGSMRLTVY